MLFHVFSSPHEGDFFSLAEKLSCRLFRNTLGAVNFLADRLGAARLQLDAEALAPERISTRLWSPEVGHVLLGMGRARQADWPWMSAQLALTAFLKGLLDRVALVVDGDGWLDVSGHSIRGERLIIEGEPGRLVVSGQAGEVLLLLKQIEPEGLDPVWTRDDGDDLVRLGSAGMASFADGKYVDHWEPADQERAPHSRQYKAQIEEAVSLLEECVPPFYVWVAALLREIVALAKVGPGTRSSSSLAWPGHVRMTAGATLVETINMLVHESCHQYFYLVQSCSRVARTDAPEVYSVLKQTARPLERVLLGFHAFGNVLLAHEALLDGRHPIDRAEIERERDSTRRVVVRLDESLQGSWDQHLEESGKELYLPLRGRLADAGLLPSMCRRAG